MEDQRTLKDSFHIGKGVEGLGWSGGKKSVSREFRIPGKESC